MLFMYNYDQTCWVPVFGMTTTWNDNLVILRSIFSKPLRSLFFKMAMTSKLSNSRRWMIEYLKNIQTLPYGGAQPQGHNSSGLDKFGMIHLSPEET